ncbi:luciferase family oxidoreductase group 1 [Kineococcus xinjiangensis]|uniref:Luciferase family oxidoreductase group 1 n=1 Tax=Kineococcus xinjiangensis TaxID=512762 RepID=A0A2S6IWA1_9ACTN|nr:LLM class flavin-dependent oxidoreductase [Kineococcus xinjiangensis]PPK98431.1 luciferase family oxidoreductase group 1 [Kineococcus xinjiangensis]
MSTAEQPWALSVLDLSPVPSGTAPSRALHETVELARHAERLGYRRYWLAEHHNIPSVASTSPEVMIATVAAATTTIRVGSGGVMLPNHSPLKVAETFRVLEALHPGRIDLGIGRAPGTDPRTAVALRRSRELLGADDFPTQFAELRGYADGFDGPSPFSSVRAMPDDVPLPPVWILGSSTYGAEAAADLGTGYAYAGHFGSVDPAVALRTYRSAFRPSVHWPRPHAILAVAVLCAETEQRAEELAVASDLSFLRLRSGRPAPLPSPEEAAAHPWTELDRALAAEHRSHLVAGTPEQVLARLRALQEATLADELMVMTHVHDPAERRRSYELLAEVAGLPAVSGVAFG